jgi:hypothetical protein
MKNLTVIVPVYKLDSEEKQNLFINAVNSVDDSKIFVVGPEEDILIVEKLKTNKILKTIINKSDNTSYPAQINMALKDVKSDYFSVLEYDDVYTSIWFKNVEEYIENDTENTFAFLPLTEVIDVKYGPQGYANEAVWASSFSDELGCYDSQCLEDYLNFNTSGAVFKTEDFISLGGLKASMKLSFWYEFLLRASYKQKRIFVIPKVGYYHTIGREDSLSRFYGNNLSEEEANWWIELAKKEYFFPHDRNKTYQTEE